MEEGEYEMEEGEYEIEEGEQEESKEKDQYVSDSEPE